MPDVQTESKKQHLFMYNSVLSMCRSKSVTYTFTCIQYIRTCIHIAHVQKKEININTCIVQACACVAPRVSYQKGRTMVSCWWLMFFLVVHDLNNAWWWQWHAVPRVSRVSLKEFGCPFGCDNGVNKNSHRHWLCHMLKLFPPFFQNSRTRFF